jgi:hypothetical protein
MVLSFYRHNVGANLAFAQIRAITRIAPTKKQYNYSLKVRPKGAKLSNLRAIGNRAIVYKAIDMPRKK